MGQREIDWSGKHGAEGQGPGPGRIGKLYVRGNPPLYGSAFPSPVSVGPGPLKGGDRDGMALFHGKGSSLDAHSRHSKIISVISGKSSAAWGGYDRRMKLGSSHKLDQPPVAKVRTGAVGPVALGPGSG